MKNADRQTLVLLTLGVAFIWLFDRAWLGAPDEFLPLLGALPLLVWFAGPWKFSPDPFRLNSKWLGFSALFAVAGWFTGFNILLALAWTSALWAWGDLRLETNTRARLLRLLPLAVLAFPWLTLDFPSLGWWFRLSAAWTSQYLFAALGFTVERAGTQLMVARMPFDVTPACAGLKALQAMAIGGTALCFLQIRRTGSYWLGLACLPLLAWIANTLRVAVIVVAALTVGPEFASGWFHTTSGWLILTGIFALSWLATEFLRRPARPLKTTTIKAG